MPIDTSAPIGICRLVQRRFDFDDEQQEMANKEDRKSCLRMSSEAHNSVGERDNEQQQAFLYLMVLHG
jgi:hypothetical protein